MALNGSRDENIAAYYKKKAAQYHAEKTAAKGRKPKRQK